MKLTIALAVSLLLSACATDVEEPTVTWEEVQAVMNENSAKFLAANTHDGVFYVPRPPSVQDEVSYSDCSHTWTNVWYLHGVIPAGTQWHVSRCNGGSGEYCTWIDVWLESAIDPTGDGMDPVCTPTACSCVDAPGDGGGECGCSGYCGSSCCI